MQFRTPLKKVKGLGSARSGVHHWWMQRLTSLALVPLLLWFVYSLSAMTGHDYAAVREWVAQPWVALLLILTMATGLYHGQLGLQVVIEDYVHTPWIATTLQIAVKFLLILFGGMGIFAVLRLATGH